MDLSKLLTETRNPETIEIDNVTTSEMLRMINNEDKKIAFAVEKELDQIAKAVDAIVEAFRHHGRLIY
ncbi:MAG TPA: N-acetylmuramic acid 6-phosphate etherase, partial [Clostridiaceae bacterium]|nr:N-acetylmuramic acid 6-phosphate etherase [Clostridiaceae bacterium]